MKYFVVSIIIASFLGYSLQQEPNIVENPSQDTKKPAVTPRNSTGVCVCVPYYLCKKHPIATNTDGGYLIDIRVNEGEGECSNYLDVCCMLPDVTQVPTTPEPIEHPKLGQSIDDLIKDIFQNGEIDTKNPAVTPRNPTAGCVCVPYYLCNNDSRINTDGVGLIDITIDEDEGECASYLDFCCLPPYVTQVPIKPKPVEHDTTGCGYRNEDGVGFRITRDVEGEAKFGEFPWMVAQLEEGKMEGSDKVSLQCGGALIHPQAVVTAAHCISDRSKSLKIRAGEWDLQTKHELYPHQDKSVKFVEIHPDYYAGALLNDIAVLILDEPYQLAENVDVICLPPQGEVIPEGTKCFSTGWGKDAFGENRKYKHILKRVVVPVVRREKCQTSLRTTRLGAVFQLHKSFICAGGEPGKDTCKGDGGSPLVCPISGHKERYQHAGIVAWGIGCGENNIPGVYVNVALFKNWIDEQIKKHNLDTKSYNY